VTRCLHVRHQSLQAPRLLHRLRPPRRRFHVKRWRAGRTPKRSAVPESSAPICEPRTRSAAKGTTLLYRTATCACATTQFIPT
jgi:hypothetical protein